MGFEILRPAQPPAPHEPRTVTVKLTPDSDGGWRWIDDFRHDLEGAIRSFRYLAQKSLAAYDVNDPKRAKIEASIQKHLATVESLKTSLVDELLKP